MSFQMIPNPPANRLAITHVESGQSMNVPWNELDDLTEFLIEMQRARDEGAAKESSATKFSPH